MGDDETTAGTTTADLDTVGVAYHPRLLLGQPERRRPDRVELLVEVAHQTGVLVVVRGAP